MKNINIMKRLHKVCRGKHWSDFFPEDPWKYEHYRNLQYYRQKIWNYRQKIWTNKTRV
jgi:hypothetical protein